MTQKHESPASQDGAIKLSAGELTKNNDSRYPATIKISTAAETFIQQLATDLLLGNCELSQLPPSLNEFYTFAWAAGLESSQTRIRKLEYDCDRLWMSAFGTVPKINPNAYSYAERQRLLGNEQFAKEVEAQLDALFEEKVSE